MHVQHLKQQQLTPPALCVLEDGILITGPALFIPMILYRKQINLILVCVFYIMTFIKPSPCKSIFFINSFILNIYMLSFSLKKLTLLLEFSLKKLTLPLELFTFMYNNNIFK